MMEAPGSDAEGFYCFPETAMRVDFPVRFLG